MKLQIITKPKSRINKVVKLTDSVYEVSTTAPPVGGRANDAVINMLSEYFCLHKNQVQIITGFTSRNKVVVIDSDGIA